MKGIKIGIPTTSFCVHGHVMELWKGLSVRFIYYNHKPPRNRLILSIHLLRQPFQFVH